MKLWLILRKHLTIKPQVFQLFVCFVIISLLVPENISFLEREKSKNKPPVTSKPRKIIKQIASEITVKIWAMEPLGSGIIWESQDSSYLVVTNKHVLRGGEQPYHIQTPDGQIHHARVLKDSRLDNYDIAILRFRAVHSSYQTAILGNLANLTVGESIFAAGFPYTQENVYNRLQESPHQIPGLVLKTGRISIVLDKALEEGYRIGYTSDVKKGMSGGPLLNSQGEVVGVNGKHAYPLWDAPDFYEDGSQPCLPLQKLITRSSLAIPMETIWQLAPPATFLSKYQGQLSLPMNPQDISANSNQDKSIQALIDQMQIEAKLSKNCQEPTANVDLSEVQ